MCITMLTSNERAKQGTNGEKAYDEALNSGGESAGRDVSRSTALGEAQEEVIHEENIADLCVHGAVNRSASGRLRRILGRRVPSRTSAEWINREQTQYICPKNRTGYQETSN